MTIHLVRHGQTAGNATRVLQTPETPLDETGLRQAERLGRRLAGERVAGILASDLSRAEMTARAVARATGAGLTLTELLHERNFGDLRGTAYADLPSDPFAPDFAPPGGETWQAFHRRVDRAWDEVVRVAAATPGDLVVVTHGLVCASIVQRCVTLPAELAGAPESPALRFRNTSVTLLAGPEPSWVVTLLGCVAHLEDLAEAKGPAPTGL